MTGKIQHMHTKHKPGLNKTATGMPTTRRLFKKTKNTRYNFSIANNRKLILIILSIKYITSM